jgi:hypothetical protein
MFVQRYNKATQIKEQQDEYCAQALSGNWEGLGEFPDDLQWEALVDVVRGRVKVSLRPLSVRASFLLGRVRLTRTATKLSI